MTDLKHPHRQPGTPEPNPKNDRQPEDAERQPAVPEKPAPKPPPHPSDLLRTPPSAVPFGGRPFG